MYNEAHESSVYTLVSYLQGNTQNLAADKINLFRNTKFTLKGRLSLGARRLQKLQVHTLHITSTPFAYKMQQNYKRSMQINDVSVPVQNISYYPPQLRDMRDMKSRVPKVSTVILRNRARVACK